MFPLPFVSLTTDSWREILSLDEEDPSLAARNELGGEGEEEEGGEGGEEDEEEEERRCSMTVFEVEDEMRERRPEIPLDFFFSSLPVPMIVERCAIPLSLSLCPERRCFVGLRSVAVREKEK